MSISIDSQSLIIAMILINLIMILFIIAYKQKLKTEQSIRCFLYGKFLYVIAYFIFAMAYVLPIYFRAILPPYMTILVANMLIFGAIVFECIALLSVVGAYTQKVKINYTIIALLAGAVFITAYFLADDGIRNVIISVLSAMLIIYPVARLLFNRQSTVPQRMAGALYMAMLITFLFKAFYSYSYPGMDVWMQHEQYSLTSFAIFVLMVMGNNAYILIAKEQTDLELARIASTDGLTGLLNRNAFNERAAKAILYAARKKTMVSFILFDIDCFKRVNDTYGHYIGDTVLKEVALLFKESMRGYDLFSRYGGDEFAVLLPGASAEEAMAVSGRMVKKMGTTGIYGNTKLRVTISLGITSIVPKKETTLEMLYKKADEALYEAKHQGGNCAVLQELTDTATA